MSAHSYRLPWPKRLFLGLALVGIVAAVVAYTRYEDRKEAALVNTSADACWNIDGLQRDVPDGYAMVNPKALSSRDLTYFHRGEKTRVECVTRKQLRVKQDELNAKADAKFKAAEAKATAALGEYLTKNRPSTWVEHLEAALNFFCTYNDDGAYRPASEHYARYWRANVDHPMPQDFGQAASKFCGDGSSSG